MKYLLLSVVTKINWIAINQKRDINQNFSSTMASRFGEILTDDYKIAEYFKYSFLKIGVCTGDNVRLSYATYSGHTIAFNFDFIKVFVLKRVRAMNPRRPHRPWSLPASASTDGAINFRTSSHIRLSEFITPMYVQNHKKLLTSHCFREKKTP